MKITIKTKPIGVNALYRGRRFLTQEGKNTKDAMAWEAKSQWREVPIDTDGIAVKIDFFFPKKRSLDIDGAIKALLDCMTGIVWKDDRLINELHAYKWIDKDNPRVELEITNGKHHLKTGAPGLS